MRVLCAAVSGPGHAYPILSVALALRDRGHQPVVALEPRHETSARDNGLEFLPIPGIAPEDPSRFEPYGLALALAQRFEPAVARLALDVAVVDTLALGVALACEMHGVPWATLLPHPLPLPSRDLAPFGAGRKPGRTPLGRWSDARARARQRLSFEAGRDDCNRIRRLLGLQPLDRIDIGMSREMILVGAHPAMEPPRSDWPAHAHVVGPCLFEPPGMLPKIPEGDEPLVLIAASTAHSGDLVHEAVRAVERAGARAVVTTGAGPAPRVRDACRVVVAPHAPHGALVARADAVVCNGGGGIVGRAMAGGVPLLVVPGHGDQKENAWRVERAGAGLWVRSPRGLSRALPRVLRPRFRERAREIAAQPADGPANAAGLVERLGTPARR